MSGGLDEQVFLDQSVNGVRVRMTRSAFGGPDLELLNALLVLYESAADYRECPRERIREDVEAVRGILAKRGLERTKSYGGAL